MSASMFRAENAAQRLKKIVMDSAIAPQDLSLELTERDCMDHEEATHAALAELRRFGVKIHMDDFGTGIRRCPLSPAVRLRHPEDRQIFRPQYGHRGDSTAIIKTIVGLGRMLNMNVVAEGVESQSQFDALVSMVALRHRVSGSPPVPPNEAGELIRQSRVEH